MKTNRYYAAGLSAFIIWGFIPFPLKALAAFSSSHILYFRILFSLLSLLLVSGLFYRKRLLKSIRFYRLSPWQEKRKFLLFTSLGGLLLTVNWLIFIYVLNHINIQTASFSYLICPILTALLGFFILKEPLKVNQWIAIALSMVSCILIGAGSLLNLGFSLMIALSYAFYLISQRVMKDYDKIFILTLQLIVSFSIIAPFYEYFSGPSQEVSGHFYLNIAFLSLGFTVLPLLLNLYALKKLPSATVGVLMYLNPIINFLVAFFYFGEGTTIQQAFAYFIIFLSVLLYNINFNRLGRQYWYKITLFKS